MDGVSLADQSYQSFKNKEIRDSESPNGDGGGFVQKTMRNSINNDGVLKPNTSGWNITSSSTVNPDGSGYKHESLATTEGSRKIDGGQHEFSGVNKHMEKASHHGDDKNFIKSAAENSNTQLQESSVVGDEKSGRTEKKSSTVVSSSSKSFSQKQSTSGNLGDFDTNTFGIDSPLIGGTNHLPALLERRDSTQSNMSNATDYSTRSNTNQSLKEKLAMTRQNVESRSTSSIREEETHKTQKSSTSSTTNQQQQQQQQQQHRHYEIGGQHHLRETDNYEREHQKYQDDIERKLAQELSQQKQHTQRTTTEHVTSQQKQTHQQQQHQQQQQKNLRQTENLTREEQNRQQKTSAVDSIDERYLTKHTDSTGTTVKKSGVINQDSPAELQAQFEKLKSQPGRILSEEISYPKPGVKMITTKKELSDGTVVTTRDYETKTPKEIIRDEKVVAGSTERSKHIKYNTNINNTTNDREFTKSVDQRGQQILRNTTTDATDSTNKINRTVQTNRDVVDHSRTQHDDYVEKIKNAVETLDLHQTVKKDLSQTMRDANITRSDFIETDHGCALIDANTGRPVSERYTSDACDRSNTSVREDRQEHDYQSKDVRQHKIVREDDFHGTKGFPSQRAPNDNRSPAGEKLHKIHKDDDGFRGTHGFPSARSPDRKSQYSTTSTNTEHYEQRSQNKHHDDDFRGTHGFPSARSPQDNDQPTRRPDQHVPQKSVPKGEDFRGTHGFPSARAPTDRRSPSGTSEISEHYEKRSNKTVDESFKGTHGFPSARSPDRERPHDKYPTPKAKQPVDKDFRGTHGFPSAPVDKSEQTRVETNQQQFTSNTSTKHVDANHEAFARSLRCASPIDSTRRGSNASQRSFRTTTHSVHGSTRSQDSPGREKSVMSDSSHISSGTVNRGTAPRTPTKHHSKEVHHSNETIDLPAKTVTTKTTTTKITSHDATPGEIIKKKNVSNLNRNLGIRRFTPSSSAYSPSKLNNRKPVKEPEIKKKTAFVDDRFIGAVEVVEEPCLKKLIKPLCPDGCPLPNKLSTTKLATNTNPNVLKKSSITKTNHTPSSSGKPQLKSSTKSPTKSYLQPTTASRSLTRSAPSTNMRSDLKTARSSVRPTTRTAVLTRPSSLTNRVVVTKKTDTITTKPPHTRPALKRPPNLIAKKTSNLKSTIKSSTKNDIRPKSKSPTRVDFETKTIVTTKIRESSKSPTRSTSKSPTRSPTSKSPTRMMEPLDHRSPFKHYLEPTESVKIRLNASADDYVEQELRKKNDHRFEPIGIEIIDKRSKSRSPTRSSVSPTRSSIATTMSKISFEEKINALGEDGLTEEQQLYRSDFQTTDSNDPFKPFTIKGPVPKSCPEGYIPIQVTKKVTTDFKEIADNTVTYPEFLNRPKTPTKEGSTELDLESIEKLITDVA